MFRIGITLGDITGIGPEVTLKALATETKGNDTQFVLIGDGQVIHDWNTRLKLGLTFSQFDASSSASSKSPGLFIFDAAPGSLPGSLQSGAPEAARAAHRWLGEAADLCLDGQLQAVVTAPVSKEAIIRAGIPFIGQTEFFTERAGVNRTVMMLLGPDDRERWLRVALATAHIALREVPVQLTPEKVLLAIERASEACGLLGLSRSRVAVCGLNPHAGEGGEFGDEESRVIDPAIQQARADGLDVVGPLSGDTVFHHALLGDYDAVVAMYHDQGLAPLKLAAFDRGVNWTLGLPFIRTSPDHGTAYNIAGKGIANPSSMVSALQLARQLAQAKSGR